MDLEAFASNTGQDWFTAALAAVITVALLRLTRWAAVRFIERGPQEGAATPLRRFAASIARPSHPAVILAAAVYSSSTFLTLPEYLERSVHAVIVLAVVAQAGLWGRAAITFVLTRQTERDPDFAAPGVIEAIRYLGTLALWSLLVILALDNLGFEITALVASLGIGGIALGLAAQSALGDLFASLAIVLDRPFAVGDFVAVRDMSGNVERIGVKTTHLRSISGEQLVFSNSDVLSSVIRNYGRMTERRAVLALGVTYDTALEQVEAIPRMIQEAIEQQSAARFDRAHFRRFGESALEFEAVYYMLTSEYAVYMDAQQAINLELLRRFREAGVEFAVAPWAVRV